MDGKLIALKLFLDELGVSSSIDSVADRKRLQKAVYLGQLSGVDLGYRFSWYVMGPYSPPLTRDYYELSDELDTDDEPLGDAALRPEIAKRLATIRPLLEVPSGLEIPQEDWLELVASYDFLRRVSGYSHKKAVEVLNEQKAHVVEFVDQAQTALQKVGLSRETAMV